jgi:uncharacterized membrane protein
MLQHFLFFITFTVCKRHCLSLFVHYFRKEKKRKEKKRKEKKRKEIAISNVLAPIIFNTARLLLE